MISIGVPTPGVTSDYHELPRLLGSDGWAADPDGAEGHGLARLSGGRGAVGAARGRCRFFVAFQPTTQSRHSLRNCLLVVALTAHRQGPHHWILFLQMAAP